MNDSPELAKLAARALADAIEHAPSAPPDADAARAIAGLRAAIVARAAKRRRARIFGAVAAAAAVVIVGGGATFFATRATGSAASGPAWHAQGAAEVVAAAGTPALPPGAVASGARVVAGGVESARLAWPSGTEVVLSPRSEVSLVEHGRANVFRLERGSLAARVAKLEPGERFVVRTHDTEVEVRGTAFDLSLVGADEPCADVSRTRLRVTEGKVAVRHAGAETFVAAGESWPTCPTTARVDPPPVATATSDPPAPSSAAPPSTAQPALTRPASTAGAPASSLSEQNDLFAEGVAAKRRGDPGAAVAAFDRLLARYPGGPLSESAVVERMKVLESVDRRAARQAATDYLRRYPRGFGRADAEALLGRTAP